MVSTPRPGPLWWLWYAFGGGLPARFAPWVLHDTTSRTWWVRHVIRLVVQLAPFVAAIVIFVPGPISLRVMSALGGAIMGLIFGVAYLHETVEHRLVKAGYPEGTGVATRAERTRDKDEAAAARYAERWRSAT